MVLAHGEGLTGWRCGFSGALAARCCTACFLFFFFTLISVYMYMNWKGGGIITFKTSDFVCFKGRLDRFFTSTLIYCLLLTWIMDDGVCPQRSFGAARRRSAGSEPLSLKFKTVPPYFDHFLERSWPEHYHLGPLVYLTPMNPEGQRWSVQSFFLFPFFFM